MKKTLVSAILIMGLMSAGASAQGLRDAQDTRAVPVRYVDLDLAQPDDATMLLSRLNTAARRACASHAIANPNARARRMIALCHEEALAAAVQHINAPELTRLHQGRTEARLITTAAR